MALKTIYTGATGINNKVDPVRLKFDSKTGVTELAEAVNCDIDDTGRISRRLGQEQISSVASHSPFCDGGDCFFAQDRTSDTAIYRFANDFSFAGVRSGLAKGLRLSWFQMGDETFYSNGVQNGVIESGVSSAWPDQSEHVGANTTREFYPAPVGTHIAYFKGCAWIAVDNVIYVSEPHAVGKFAPARRSFFFGSNVVMMRPVENGVWVSNSAETGFIAFEDNFKNMRWIKKASVPAHEWSDNHELVDLSDTSLEVTGLNAVWSSNDGLCVGTSDGQLIVPTEDKLIYPAGATGATVVKNGKIINSIW